MFEVPESDIVSVHIDEEVILGKKSVQFVRQSPIENNKTESSDDTQGKSAEPVETEQSKAKTYA
jgi:hypothetical protein